jgi:gluconokinase
VSDAIVVMGVSGCGKSTLARALADTLGFRFVEGDDLHPPANVAKMAAGIPLDDEDREPFLLAVADALRDGQVVAACSALKRKYRDLIRREAGAATFVLPFAKRAIISARLAARAPHFMPATLLDSQFATLELPQQDEDAILVDAELPCADQVATVIDALTRQDHN